MSLGLFHHAPAFARAGVVDLTAVAMLSAGELAGLGMPEEEAGILARAQTHAARAALDLAPL